MIVKQTSAFKLRLVSSLGSAAAGAMLLIILFAISRLNAITFEQSLLRVPPQAFLGIAALLAINNFLAGEKWRVIASVIPNGGKRAIPRPLYFAFTSIGVALGQVVPAPLALVASRSLGAHLHGGRALVRGAGATLFDYFFDVVVAAMLALCSVLVLIAGGGGAAWAGGAALIILLGLLLYRRAARFAAGLAERLANRAPDRYRSVLATASASPLLKPEIGCPLLAISAFRFAVIVTMAAISAKAIGANIAVWQLAAALPFSVIAIALPITPGGLGVSEWTLGSVLLAFGIPFQVSAEWALATRVLVAIAAMSWGAIGLAIATGVARKARIVSGPVNVPTGDPEA